MKNFFKNLFGAKSKEDFSEIKTEHNRILDTNIERLGEIKVEAERIKDEALQIPKPKGIIENHFDVNVNGKNEILVFDRMKTTRKKKEGLSPTQIRLIKHFLLGRNLSIKSMWEVRISNCSREILRYIEQPFEIELSRKRVDWKENGEHGFYLVYSLKSQDREKLLKIARDNGINI